MTYVDQRRFLSALRAKEAEIAVVLSRRDGLAVQTGADAFDEIQDAIDRSLLVRNLSHGAELLREVHSAVERIEKGEYGPCQECGHEINPKRLAAVPWAALCLPCQEKADANSPVGNREWPSMKETIVDSYPELGGKVCQARRRVAAAGGHHSSHVSGGSH